MYRNKGIANTKIGLRFVEKQQALDLKVWYLRGDAMNNYKRMDEKSMRVYGIKSLIFSVSFITAALIFNNRSFMA